VAISRVSRAIAEPVRKTVKIPANGSDLLFIRGVLDSLKSREFEIYIAFISFVADKK
jgi:hypothetical protein